MIIFNHRTKYKYIIGNIALAIVVIGVLPRLTQWNAVQQWISGNALIVIFIISSLTYWCCAVTRELLNNLSKLDDLREQLRSENHFHFLLLPDVENLGSAEKQEINTNVNEGNRFNVTFFIIPIFDEGRYSSIYSGSFVKFVIYVLLRDLEVNKTRVKCINLEVDSISLEQEHHPNFEKVLSIEGKAVVNKLSRGKPLRCIIPLQVTGGNPTLQVKVKTSEANCVSYLTQVYDSEKIRVKIST